MRYISLDRPSTAYRAEHSGEDFLKSIGFPSIIDEIQYAPSLFRHIKHFIDRQTRQKLVFLLTGSQQFHLMAGVAESLAGRVALLNLHSLSASELISHFKWKLNQKKIRSLIFKGGYPEIWSTEQSPDEFFSNYISSYIQRDIRQIIQLKNLHDFDIFMGLLAGRAGQLLNYSKLACDVGVSSPTIKLWVNALEAGNIIFLLKPFYNSFGKRLVKTPKVYFMDTGLLCHLIGFRQEEELQNSNLMGKLFENFVLGQIIKSESGRGKKPNLFFYRDHSGLEIDFVRPVGEKLHLYECKWSEQPDIKLKAFDEIQRLIGKKNILSKNIFSSCIESYSKGNHNVLSLNDNSFPGC